MECAEIHVHFLSVQSVYLLKWRMKKTTASVRSRQTKLEKDNHASNKNVCIKD